MADCITSIPKVFRIPQCKQNPKLVALMMPFDAAFLPVSSTIKKVALSVELECKRVDDIWHDSEIIQDVFELIFQSAFVVCDFSGKNPNVFYEAGIAHTLGRDVIPIVQNEGDIPFDLRQHRYIKYMLNNEGLIALERKLAVRMKELMKQHVQMTSNTPISPVFVRRTNYEDRVLY